MEDRCVCCGAIVPEGRMVCLQCEMDAREKRLTESAKAMAETSERILKNRPSRG